VVCELWWAAAPTHWPDSVEPSAAGCVAETGVVLHAGLAIFGDRSDATPVAWFCARNANVVHAGRTVRTANAAGDVVKMVAALGVDDGTVYLAGSCAMVRFAATPGIVQVETIAELPRISGTPAVGVGLRAKGAVVAITFRTIAPAYGTNTVIARSTIVVTEPSVELPTGTAHLWWDADPTAIRGFG
jgi:hypothetical protein